MSASIGEPLPRVDGHAKITGQAKYSAEMSVAGAVYGVMVMSPIARGRITGIDAREAEREPGVIAVLSHLNAMKLPGGAQAADPGDRVVQALQDDSIVFSNQPIALVVADTFERATAAALRVQVETKSEPAVVRLEDEPGHGVAHDIQNAAGTQPADQTQGDPQRAYEDAHAQVDAVYSLPPETHNPMEPHATLAVWSGPDRLTVYDGTQGIFGVQKKLAKSFALPPDHVHVITKFVGGGFGCKGSVWSHVVLASLAAKQLNRPVKVVLSRPQMFGMVGGRPQIQQQLQLGADRNGELVAITHHSTSTTSRFDTFLEPAASVSRHAYACENIETSHRLVRLDIGTPTYMRAPGESSGGFALESAMDELAHKLDLDPLVFRLKNYAETDPTEGKPFSSKSLRQCYELGAKKFGWSERPKKPRSRTNRDGWHVGYGMATASYPANQSPAQAVARLLPDGSARVESGAVDLGGGTYTVMAQVAADAIGLPVEKVTFDLGDTEMPEAPRSGGSQTAASVSSAVMVAGHRLRDRLIQMAIADARSPIHGADLASVRAERGELISGSQRDPFTDVLRRAGGRPIEERGSARPEPERKKFSLHAFGAQFAEVHVDPDLGTIRVARMIGVFAAGRILNARLARSQLIGGMVWSIGMALHEHAVYDPKLGRIVTRDLADYHVPTHLDVPAIEAYAIDEEDPHVDLAGVKGLGEIGITGGAAAIANAVFNATGTRVRALPITPDTLL